MKSPVRHNIRVSFVNDEKVVSPPKNPTVKNKERYINTYSKKDLYGNDRIIITKLS
jgi:hypothetical protein